MMMAFLAYFMASVAFILLHAQLAEMLTEALLLFLFFFIFILKNKMVMQQK